MPAGNHTCATQFVHEVAHVQPLADIVFRVQAAARVDSVPALCNHLRGQRDIRSHYQVICLQQLHNAVIRHVKARRHLQALHITGRRRLQVLVRDQCDRYPDTLRGAEQNFLHHTGTGIGINPDLHT